jgi:glycosyltransferase involved in cell wall biosynthesis
MRLALVTETYPPEVNGVAMTLHRLVTGLSERGHDVVVVRPTQSVEGSGFHPLAEEWVFRGLPLPGYPGLRFGLPAGFELRRRWREDPPDVVHVATEGPLGLSAVWAARRLGLPVSSSFHTNFHTYSGHYGFGLLRNVALKYLRAVHNRTACTLVPSSSMKEVLRKDGFRNLEILGRGVDTELFSPAKRDPALRREWGAEDDDEPVVIYVGRLADEKNIPLVVEAHEAMARLRPGLKLVLVGDGPSRASLEAKHPEFHYAGMRLGEDLARHYASADLFLFPSVTETFGNVVTEGLASGLVVLAFDYAAAQEHIQTTSNGRTATFGDREAFVQAACDLIRRPETWKQVRTRARATAVGLSWSAIVESFESRLESVAAAPAGGAVDFRAKGERLWRRSRS